MSSPKVLKRFVGMTLSFLAIPLCVLAELLPLPNGSYLRTPPGTSDAEVPFYRCYAYSRDPSLFFNRPPAMCGEHTFTLVERYETNALRLSLQTMPLPDGTWYRLREGQTIKSALCEAYVKQTDAFRGSQQRVEQFGCELPIGRRISQAVGNASGWVDSRINSARGLNGGDACIQKYVQEVRLPDARSVLGNACYWAYEKGLLDGSENKSEYQKASRCIVSGVDRLFSFEATLSLVNSCTRSMKAGAEIFQRFRSSLYAMQENERELQVLRDEIRRGQDRRILRNEILLHQAGPLIINTPNGLVHCHRMGSMLDCF
jgi:hypothetical protein